MKKIICLALLLVAVSVHGDSAKKEPWLWSPQERIQERFRPESKEARRQSAFAHGTRVSPPGAWPIDGNTHPELFFPWELMDHLLRMQTIAPGDLHRLREGYRTRIEAAGWNFDTFWTELDVAAGDYLGIRDRMMGKQPGIGRDLSRGDERRLAAELCASRAAALNTMRAKFGTAAFDRFLYTEIARGLRSWSNEKRDAGMLMRVEKGCKPGDSNGSEVDQEGSLQSDR